MKKVSIKKVLSFLMVFTLVISSVGINPNKAYASSQYDNTIYAAVLVWDSSNCKIGNTADVNDFKASTCSKLQPSSWFKITNDIAKWQKKDENGQWPDREYLKETILMYHPRSEVQKNKI